MACTICRRLATAAVRLKGMLLLEAVAEAEAACAGAAVELLEPPEGLGDADARPGVRAGLIGSRKAPVPAEPLMDTPGFPLLRLPSMAVVRCCSCLTLEALAPKSFDTELRGGSCALAESQLSPPTLLSLYCFSADDML